MAIGQPPTPQLRHCCSQVVEGQNSKPQNRRSFAGKNIAKVNGFVYFSLRLRILSSKVRNGAVAKNVVGQPPIADGNGKPGTFSSFWFLKKLSFHRF
jgi:hypothetical protein